MKTFYWYAGGIVALFILALAVSVIHALYFSARTPGNDPGYSSTVAIVGPMVAFWLIAFGWTVAIFWRKFMLQDPTLSQATFVIAILVLLSSLKAPFDIYKNFLSPTPPRTTESGAEIIVEKPEPPQKNE